jgi:hypothetical protein
MKKEKSFLVKLGNQLNLHHKLLFIFFAIFLLTSISCFSANEGEVLNNWIGKHPIENSKNLLKNKILNINLNLVIGAELSSKLINLENEPYYLTSPIEKKYNFFILHYPANLHINREGDMIFLFINEETNKFHFAQIIDGKITWKHGEEVNFPQELKEIPSKWAY